jgi:hypothetical protein
MRGVSVIIRVRDERANLERCLGLLAAQRDVGRSRSSWSTPTRGNGTAGAAHGRGARVSAYVNCGLGGAGPERK